MVFKILLPLLFLGSTVAAQINPVWVRGFGDVLNDHSEALAIDDSGNVHCTGWFDGSFDIDPGPGTHTLTSTSFHQLFFAKFSAAGQLLWAGQINAFISSRGVDIDIDKTGNVYVLIRSEGDFDADPGPSSHMVYDSDLSSTDIALLKLDPNGQFLWLRHLNGDEHDIPQSIAFDALGNVCVSGAFASSRIDFDPGPDSAFINLSGVGWDMFIWKLDPAGNYVSAISFEGDNVDYAEQLTYSTKNEALLSGRFKGTIDCDPGTDSFLLYTYSPYDGVISKLRSDGSFHWARQYSNGVVEVSKYDSKGNVIISGSLYGEADFEPGPATVSIGVPGRVTGFVAALDSLGELMWVKSVSGMYVRAMVLDEHDNIFVSGAFSDSADFDPGPGIHIMSPDSLGNAFVLTLNPEGEFVWASHFGGKLAVGAWDLAIDCGHLYVTGSFCGTADFDPGKKDLLISATGSSPYYANFYLGKYDLKPPTPYPITSPADLCAGQTATLTLANNTLAGYTTEWFSGDCNGETIGSGETMHVTASSSATIFVQTRSECAASNCAELNLTVLPSPHADFGVSYLNGDCSGLTAVLNNRADAAAEIYWSNGATYSANNEFVLPYESNQPLSQVVVGSNGCRDTLQLNVNTGSLTDHLQLFIPNVFSPNGDGNNDELKITCDGNFGDCYTLRIFDRWGLEIYSSNALTESWTGNGANGPVPAGTYFYTCDIAGSQQQGSITLVR